MLVQWKYDRLLGLLLNKCDRTIPNVRPREAATRLSEVFNVFILPIKKGLGSLRGLLTYEAFAPFALSAAYLLTVILRESLMVSPLAVMAVIS